MTHKSDDLINKLKILESLSTCDEADARAFKRRLDALRDLTLALLEEIETLENVRTVNLRRGINLHEEMRQFEIHLIQSALERTGGHQTRAAQLLGINLTTLHNKLKRLNISPEVKAEAPVLHEDGGDFQSVRLHSYNGRLRSRTSSLPIAEETIQ
jgi:DNA-binding NtrC family response regulator